MPKFSKVRKRRNMVDEAIKRMAIHEGGSCLKGVR